MLKRDIADRLQILVVNRFREEQPERELTKEEIKNIWDNIYARLNWQGQTEKDVEEFCKTVELQKMEG
jgi:hypothetical protein